LFIFPPPGFADLIRAIKLFFNDELAGLITPYVLPDNKFTFEFAVVKDYLNYFPSYMVRFGLV